MSATLAGGRRLLTPNVRAKLLLRYAIVAATPFIRSYFLPELGHKVCILMTFTGTLQEFPLECIAHVSLWLYSIRSLNESCKSWGEDGTETRPFDISQVLTILELSS